MQLMTSRQIAETHGINYHRIRYLHKRKKIHVVSFLPAVAGQGRVGLYNVDKVLVANGTINPRISNAVKAQQEYLSEHERRTMQDFELTGRRYAKTKKIIEEYGLCINRINHVRERDNIKPVNQQGERAMAGKNCFYDVELLLESYNRRIRKDYAKRIPGRPLRDRKKPKKTALDYRTEGRKLAWIATKMKCDIYDVMKELGIA